jgi:hypothetical protein
MVFTFVAAVSTGGLFIAVIAGIVTLSEALGTTPLLQFDGFFQSVLTAPVQR